ncbi:MAG TPA: ferritin-like domain-containing protein [Stellaceae bacterium]|nr:ferritin-like domain-containing protein [Stellaceae bacterium]
MADPATLAAGAVAILGTSEPAQKARLSAALAARWRRGTLPIGRADAPPRPARPARPLLLPPRDVPKRRNFASSVGRIALLHALAHIELNAIDLAWDLIARFGDPALPLEFFADWVAVAADEAAHFGLLATRLAMLGAAYGDLPAHDGLWAAATATADDPVARLAIVPLVLEARGLDVTPGMIGRLERVGDRESAAVLARIYRDEIGHVAAGMRWFKFFCRAGRVEPAAAFRAAVEHRFTGGLKPPFNRRARDAAGIPAAYYDGS